MIRMVGNELFGCQWIPWVSGKLPWVSGKLKLKLKGTLAKGFQVLWIISDSDLGFNPRHRRWLLSFTYFPKLEYLLFSG